MPIPLYFRRRLALAVIGVVLISSLLLFSSPENGVWTPNWFAPIPLGIGFVYRTHVISMPHRSDRRRDLDVLMTSLRISNWKYFDGIYANTSTVKGLMRNVHIQRAAAEASRDDVVTLPLQWPSDAGDAYIFEKPIRARSYPRAGSELWDLRDYGKTPLPMLCAEEDFKVQKYTSEVPQLRFLTPERVATGMSHMSVLRRIVDDNARLGVDLARNPNRAQSHISLILEDDVDMEVDIESRMAQIMRLMPYDWDVLYLGYCWSPEDTNYAIIGDYWRPSKNQLHASFQPRCLHAYAVSPAGAIRLLSHLRHPPFAFGRSVDEAIEWLIWTKRIKSFTVVPPVAVQRKVTKTDISLEGAPIWKEHLDHGVLGTMGEEI